MPSELLSGLFSAVAEAVLSHALQRLDLADRVREWLKRDPARLAYQKALARAYAAFARQYPELTASLFDEFFLKTKAAPELARQLTRHRHPDPAQLARLWAESLPGSLSQRHAAHIARAAADFLHWLESELKAEQVFQPLFDSRALESLPALEAKMDALAAELKRACEALVKQAESYTARGHKLRFSPSA
jgi:hypothetical protein